jgi:hypothetical protein
MTIEFCYWFLLLLWALSYFGVWAGIAWAPVVGSGLLLILFVLIGLKVFGAPLK